MSKSSYDRYKTLTRDERLALVLRYRHMLTDEQARFLKRFNSDVTFDQMGSELGPAKSGGWALNKVKQAIHALFNAQAWVEAETLEARLALSIGVLPLETRLYSACCWKGVKTVGELIAFDFSELLTWKNIGPSTIEKGLAALKAYGLEVAYTVSDVEKDRPLATKLKQVRSELAMTKQELEERRNRCQELLDRNYELKKEIARLTGLSVEDVKV